VKFDVRTCMKIFRENRNLVPTDRTVRHFTGRPKYILFFHVHITVHLSNTSFLNTNEMQLIMFIWFIFFNSTCFGRSPRPSSGVIFYKL